jgi:hypothetical protein
MIEAHALNERNVFGVGPGIEMFFAIALGIVDLREPVAGVDAVAKMGQT